MRVQLLCLAFALALLPAAGAEECVPSTSVTSDDQIVLEAPIHNAAADYVAIDLCQPECAHSIWPYYEMNGTPGLQRGDDAVDDTCGGIIQSDTWIHI